MPRPLSVQLYSVRTELAEDRDGTLTRIADMGFGAVEPFDVLTDPRGLRSRLDDLRLAVSGVHVIQLVKPEHDPGRILDAVAELGTTQVIVPAGIAREDFTDGDGVARAADLLNSLSERAAGRGMTLGYHNHWWEIEPTFGELHAIEVLAGLLDPAVFLEIDTYWAAVGGAEVAALLRRLGSRVKALHIKDGPGTKGDPNVAVGSGIMPVPEILAAAPEAWRIVEFDACAGDLFAELAASHTYVSALEAA
jgi:sugar phosphate isomerase/epimerase